MFCFFLDAHPSTHFKWQRITWSSSTCGGQLRIQRIHRSSWELFGGVWPPVPEVVPLGASRCFNWWCSSEQQKVLLVSPSGFSPVQTKKPQVIRQFRLRRATPGIRSGLQWRGSSNGIKHQQMSLGWEKRAPPLWLAQVMCRDGKKKGSNSGECSSDVSLYSTMPLEKILRFFSLFLNTSPVSASYIPGFRA